VKRCKFCSKNCSDDAIFCSNCGYRFETQKNEIFLEPGFNIILFCFGIIIFPIFWASFNAMGIPSSFPIGIILTILVLSGIGSCYVGWKKKDYLFYGSLSFITLNLIVGVFIFGIFNSMGNPLNLLNFSTLIYFIASTIGLSIVIVILIFFAWALVGSI